MVANELIQTIAPVLLLEREAELAALEAMLGAAQSGDGRLVLVEGSAGIGKTRLLAEARALAAEAKFEVLTARGGELEGQFAFGIVRQLFEAPLAAANPEIRAELLAGAAGLSESVFVSAPTTASGEGPESSFAILHGLYWLAANFALRTPTLLVVDDLHWADEPSLRWLIYLARRLEGLPLLLLVGTRPSLQADFPALVAELLADPAGARHSPRQPRRGVNRVAGPQPPRSRARPALHGSVANRVRRESALSARASRRIVSGGGHADRRSGSSRARARTGRDLAWDRGSPRAPAGRSDGAAACRRDPW